MIALATFQLTFQLTTIPTSLLWMAMTSINTIALAMIGLTLIAITAISVTTLAMTVRCARGRRLSSARPSSTSRLTSFVMLCLGASLFFIYTPQSNAAVGVDLNVSHAGPRAVESLTERGVLRDYRIAWISLAHALEFNALDALSGPFVATAKQSLMDSVASQRRSGLSTRYLNQNHKVEVVYYAPEGDVIELHDAADCQLQVLDGGKVIRDEHVVMRYVVLMTPAADHWVVRQLQAVSQF
jgi:hypothetical protein